MKKKFRLLTILACVFAFCMTAFIAVNVNEAKAAGESYTLSFRTNDYDIASSDETWTTYNKATVENGVATLTLSRGRKAIKSKTTGLAWENIPLLPVRRIP